MTDHPGDNADNRFRAFWAGLLGFVSFGIVFLFALKGCGPGAGDEIQLTGVDRQIVESRKANLAEILAAQSELVPGDSLEKAKSEVTAALSVKKPAKTELIVPNSPTDIKRLRDAQKQTPAAAPGAGKPAEEGKAPEESAAPKN